METITVEIINKKDSENFAEFAKNLKYVDLDCDDVCGIEKCEKINNISYKLSPQ